MKLVIVEMGGSSPLARGPRVLHRGPGEGLGLIPARAGTTEHVTKITHSSGAHPRSRGDHLCHPKIQFWYLGSSPLARGPLSATAKK